MIRSDVMMQSVIGIRTQKWVYVCRSVNSLYQPIKHLSEKHIKHKKNIALEKHCRLQLIAHVSKRALSNMVALPWQAQQCPFPQLWSENTGNTSQRKGMTHSLSLFFSRRVIAWVIRRRKQLFWQGRKTVDIKWLENQEYANKYI